MKYEILHEDAFPKVIIDNGHLVSWPDYMHYTIEKASAGWFSSIASGESLVYRFRGLGTVLIQTRNPDSFSAWMKSASNLTAKAVGL